MEMYVNAGELRHPIRIVERSGLRNANGYPVQRDDPAYWTAVRSCRAKFSQVSGTEMVKADADFTVVKARFLVRWTKTEITRKMVVLFQDKEWEITYVHDYGGGRKYMEIWAEWRSGKDGGADDGE